MANAVCNGVLRYRTDEHVGKQARPFTFRQRSDAVLATAMRSDDRRWARRDEDATSAATNLASNAGTKMVHLDGGMRVQRRCI